MYALIDINELHKGNCELFQVFDTKEELLKYATEWLHDLFRNDYFVATDRTITTIKQAQELFEGSNYLLFREV